MWYQSFNTQTNICNGGGCASDTNCFGGGTCVDSLCTGGTDPREPFVPTPAADDSSSSLLWLWIVLGVAGLLIVLLVLYYFYKKGKTDASSMIEPGEESLTDGHNDTSVNQDLEDSD